MEMQLNISVGEVHTMPLSNAAGAGYSWTVAENDVQITQVTIITENEAGNRARVPGGPVKMTVKITGLQAGSSGIKLVQRRIWEPEQPPRDTFFCRVTVAKKK